MHLPFWYLPRPENLDDAVVINTHTAIAVARRVENEPRKFKPAHN